MRTTIALMFTMWTREILIEMVSVTIVTIALWSTTPIR